jgi:phage-related baseplate assembly protein
MLIEMRLMRALRLCVAMAFVVLSVSGCMTAYVDGGLQKASLADVRRPTSPQDVQLLFQFQNKGVVNARATEMLKNDVNEHCRPLGRQHCGV